MKWIVVFSLFILIAVSQARTLSDLVKEHVIRERRDAEASEGTWVPPPGVNGQDWYSCRGMPCEQWNRTRSKIMELYRMNRRNETQLMAGDYTWTFDVVGSSYDDGSLDGCIYLTEDQADELIENTKEEMRQMAGTTSTSSRKKRKLSNFRRNSFNKWDKFPIVYKFDGHHTSREKRIIRSAFQHWMDQTCVTFREASVNEFVPDNHALITRNATGCHSYVGRVILNPQQLNLQHNCLWEFGIPVHEIGHLLGLFHEQQRVDRDDTIIVHYENLGYYTGQFARVDTVSHGVPYDVGSVMHYAPKDGSSNGRNTMSTIDPLYQSTMGQKTGISFLDAKLINKAYCSDRCRGVTLPRKCERFGYQDPLNCYRCRCPPGFGGRFCEMVAGSKRASCGGSFTASPDRRLTIESPGYPSGYENYQECNWYIKAPRGSQVELRFKDEFAVYCHSQNQCHHWVEVQYNDKLGLPGPRFCCYRTPSHVLTSTDGEMMIAFRSNWTSPYINTRTGFRAEIRAVPSHGVDPIDDTTTTTTPTPTPTTTPTTTTTTTTTVAPSTENIWTCDFETPAGKRSWCGITQSRRDVFDWTITNQKTPSQETGPDYASRGRWYIFIEASDPRRKDDNARIFLPYLKSEGYHCVKFSYHMFGFHINKLEMFREGSKGTDVEWDKKGQQGNSWRDMEIEVYLYYNDRLGFNGIRGNEFSGDIALDYMSIRKGRC